ncbi:MAG TPA: hypothetical protein VNI01_08875, partial [Elusimicrobiota bacterium]|nr:hypothetical protein [Elusimicrobiota bacterium]
TPYQQQLDNANKAGQNAGTLKMIGLMLIIMGIGLIMTGIGLLNCTTFPIGLALIGAGMALMMVGFILLAVGASQANQAKNQGNDIGNQYGQQDQGNNINQCADARYAQANPTLCSSGQAPMDSNAGLAEHANPQICERLKAEMNACFSGGGVSCDSNYKAQGC